MHITIEWFSDQFNVNLATKPDAEAFLSIKGARIVDGSKGAFVSWPATKNQSSGKWWSHCWGSEKFNAAVLEKALASKPQERQQRGRARQEDDGDPIPF